MKNIEDAIINAYQANQDPEELRQLAADSASTELDLISENLNQN